MSRKRKTEEQPSNPPDLKDVLLKARAKALAGSSPDPAAGDEENCPLLLQFLEPEIITKLDWKGQGTPPRCLREPMVMLSWDRMSGRWKWGLSDKALNLSGVAYATCLATAVADLEECFRLDRIAWKERKVT